MNPRPVAGVNTSDGLSKYVGSTLGGLLLIIGKRKIVTLTPTRGLGLSTSSHLAKDWRTKVGT